MTVTLLDTATGSGTGLERVDGKLLAAAAALLVIGGVFVVADPIGGQERSQDDLEPLRIGHVPGPLTSPHYTAIEEGFYREAGFDAEMVQLPGPEIGKALLNGDLEVGSSATTPAGYQRAAGAPIRLVAARAGFRQERGPGGAYFMARNGSGIQEPEDIRGKTVCAATSGSMGELWLYWWADQHNMTVGEDFELTYLQDETQYRTVFASGTVDACFLGGGTFADVYLRERGLAYKFDEMPNDDWVGAFVAVRQNWVEDRPEKLERFLMAYKKAAEYAREHPEERAANIAKHTKYNESMVLKADLVPVPKNLTVPVDVLNKVQSLQARYGFIDQEYEMAPMVHNDAIMQVQQALRNSGG